MLRTAIVLRRACAHHARRRFLHEDAARGDFLGFSLAKTPAADPRFGMDMTRAPGYEVAADEEPPLVGNQKLADFAARHARLSSAQVDQADGYLWIGSVLYPAGAGSDVDISFSWEMAPEGEQPAFDRLDGDIVGEVELTDSERVIEGERMTEIVEEEGNDVSVLESKRRHNGGQARRIRKEREQNIARKALKRNPKRPLRKPENDIPEDDGY